MPGPERWRVELGRAAERELAGLDPPVFERVANKLEWLARHAGEVRHLTLAGPLAGFYKLVVGDWRVIYELDADRKVLTVVRIAHRREAYR